MSRREQPGTRRNSHDKPLNWYDSLGRLFSHIKVRTSNAHSPVFIRARLVQDISQIKVDETSRNSNLNLPIGAGFPLSTPPYWPSYPRHSNHPNRHRHACKCTTTDVPGLVRYVNRSGSSNKLSKRKQLRGIFRVKICNPSL